MKPSGATARTLFLMAEHDGLITVERGEASIDHEAAAGVWSTKYSAEEE